MKGIETLSKSLQDLLKSYKGPGFCHYSFQNKILVTDVEY